MPKFVITDSYSPPNSPSLGGGLPFGFMEIQMIIAAQKAGFESYRMICQSLREENGKTTANLVSVKLRNIDLLERIIEDQEVLKSLIDTSNIRLKALYDSGKITDPNWSQHNQKISPFTAFYLHRIFTVNKGQPESQDLIQQIKTLAARDSAIDFNPEEGFLERTPMPDVDLEKFLRAEGGVNENVVYIRGLVRADDNRVLPQLTKLREITKAKFPVSPESQVFYDKQIVIDDPRLRKYTVPTICCTADEMGRLVTFYKEQGFKEGLVLKPGNGGSFGGTGIVVLDPNIADDKIEEAIGQAILKMHDDVDKRYKTDFSLQSIVAQKRLHNLSADGELRAGDIRFTIINGELIGAALRYSDDKDVKVLSYEMTKSVLPDNLSFTKENIEILRSKSSEEQKSYYDTLLKMYEAVMDVVAWSKENRHFHNGVDMLLGRDSDGSWQFCLTEVNNVVPDCIPETCWLNKLAGESEDKVKICESIVGIIQNHQHITADIQALPATAVSYQTITRASSVSTSLESGVEGGA
jgi:hypothetical protein